MRNDEMEIGKVYKVKARHGSKAKLEEKGIKRGYRDRNDGVKVTMLNGRFKDHGKLLTSRDVERIWTDEDEQRMISQDERSKRAEEMQQKLIEAGFEPSNCQVRIHDQVYLAFGPGVAERVYAELVDNLTQEI